MRLRVHHRVPFGQRVLLGLLADVHAGVVDQDVEPAEALTVVWTSARHGRLASDVDRDRDRLGAERLELLDRRRVLGGVPPGHHDRGAGLGHAPRHAEADAAVAAGDDRHPARKIEKLHARLSPVPVPTDPRRRGSRVSRRPSPEEIQAEAGHRQGDARKEADPEGLADDVLAAGDDVAPRRHVGRHADAEEAEDRLGEHGVGEDERPLHQERRHAVRQDVADGEREVPPPERPGGLDVVQLTEAQHGAADQERRPRRVHERQREDDVPHARAPGRHERDGQQDRGKRHQAVHDPHHREVEAAVVPGHQPDDGPPERGEQHGDAADEERHPAAVDHQAVDVAAELVGAEEVLGAGRPEPLDGFEPGGDVGRRAAGEDGRQQEEQEDPGARDHGPVAEEPPAPVQAGRRRLRRRRHRPPLTARRPPRPSSRSR